ncbi:MAG: type I restriction-modification system subunit M N-terminal domain-containing protein, partial [Paludibacteraceae bacterium]|nr:type I restriction-modification system subunit M N-terminal domain-containing protein [Paludibacteraceae bacterium]
MESEISYQVSVLITGELKNKIDGLWTIFWTGGLTNPLDVIEQITYLMFIKDLDDLDIVHSKEAVMLGIPFKSIFDGKFPSKNGNTDGRNFKWSVFRDLPAEEMYDLVQYGVFPFIKTIHGSKDSAYSKYMGDAIFKIPTPQKFTQIVDALDEIYKFMGDSKEKDVRGDV